MVIDVDRKALLGDPVTNISFRPGVTVTRAGVTSFGPLRKLSPGPQASMGIRMLSIIPPPGVSRGTDRILDRLEFLSDQRAANISNEDRVLRTV